MHTITESTILIRSRIVPSIGLRLATSSFCEGWNSIQSRDTGRLEKKMVMRGWNFKRIADGSPSSGVGDTAREAIASALKFALRQASERVNVVGVQRIDVVQYPWFFLASVSVCPYGTQKEATMAVPPKPLPLPLALPAARCKPQASGRIRQRRTPGDWELPAGTVSIAQTQSIETARVKSVRIDKQKPLTW